MPIYDVPGVYIEEVTSPGVIAGVTTSTTAFIGPALAGPLRLPTRITSPDDFLKLFGIPQPDGSVMPYLVAGSKRFFLAQSVLSYFLNGGAQAYVLRVGTAENTTWEVDNQHVAPEAVLRLQAQVEGPGGDAIKIQVNAVNFTTAAGVAVANPTATATVANGTQLTLNNASGFQPGDTITDGTKTAKILSIQGNILTLSAALATGSIRIADIVPAPNTVPFRMADTKGLFPGTVAILKDPTNATPQQFVVIQSIDQLGFVTLATTPASVGVAKTYSLAAASPPVLISQEFQIVTTPPTGPAETLDNLSLSPLHPRYVFSMQSQYLNILPPLVPPTASGYPASLVAPKANLAITVNGVLDDPSSLTSADYSAALDLLTDIEDVNLLVIPDAAAHAEAITIQNSMIDHCLAKKDRFAILDSRPGAPPSGPGSVAEQRLSVQADSGFAALYYPWLLVRDPLSKPTSTNPIPGNMIIPPSGAIAGVYARVDDNPGVHKAPANTDVRGVLGLEIRLSDRQQGPLNLGGTNVLRIFPGTAQVTVWGARTTVDPATTDWIYVNVRRLMIYIEQSIKVGIRPAVFEPNGIPLWNKLKHTIDEFLTRVWKDGALFGATADKAFYVRIDEGLNPPSTRALGRLYIEIGVAPVRPAEFIIVRIGLWDGGAQISEN
jgi:phage tail sheath protein FI